MIFRIVVTNACVSIFLNCQFSFLDETMAPLDPASKSQVMSRLKYFCSRSVVLVRVPYLETLLGDDARMLSEKYCSSAHSFDASILFTGDLPH